MKTFFLSLPFAHKAALICAFTSLIACSVLILATHQSQQLLVRHSAEYFSQTLAQQIAMKTSAPLMQGDKLSLQRLLDNLVDDSMVSHAAIYGIDGQPVVAAGSPKKDLLAQSASISFEDSLAGYVVISLDPYTLASSIKEHTWSLVVLSLLLAAVIYMLALFISRPLANHLKQLAQMLLQPSPAIAPLYNSDDELQELHTATIDRLNSDRARPRQSHSLLHVEIDEFESIETNDPRLATLTEQLEMLGQLYHGQCHVTRKNALALSFAANSDDELDHPFRALCCGYLLQQLHRHDDDLTLATAVTISPAADYSLNAELEYQQQLENLSQLSQLQLSDVIASPSVQEHASIEGRAEINSSGILIGFSDNYQSLLDNQLDTFKKASSS